MKRSKAPPPAAKVYQADELISLVDAIALLADRDRRRHDTDRTRKARMRQHIKYAVENSALTEVMRRGKKHYVFGRIAAWAQAKWPTTYGDLPAVRDAITGSMRATLPALTLDARGRQVPTTLPDCLRELEQALQRALSLETELLAARGEADRLRPDAEARQRQRAANRENARQPRRRGGKDFS